MVPSLPFFTELVYATSTAVLFQVLLKTKKRDPNKWECRWQHWNPTVWAPHIGSSSRGSQGVRWVRWVFREQFKMPSISESFQKVYIWKFESNLPFNMMLFLFLPRSKVNRLLVDFEYGTEAAKEVETQNWFHLESSVFSIRRELHLYSACLYSGCLVNTVYHKHQISPLNTASLLFSSLLLCIPMLGRYTTCLATRPPQSRRGWCSSFLQWELSARIR